MSESNLTARERAEAMEEECLDCPNPTAICVDCCAKAITAAEEAAFQRGKEEGRRMELEMTMVSIADVRVLNKSSIVWQHTCDELERAIKRDTLATDPPAQPTATLETRLMDLEARVQRLEGKP